LLALIDKQYCNIKTSAKILAKQHNIRKFYDNV